MRRYLVGGFAFLILLMYVPLARAASTPGVPILSFKSQGGPYPIGENTGVSFVVTNLGPDQVNGITIAAQGGQGWSVLSVNSNFDTLSSGQAADFSVSLIIGPADSIPSIIFSVRSTDHIPLSFPAMITVATGVTPDILANADESKSATMNLLENGLTYSIWQIGSIYFPTTPQGITNSPDFQGLLRGYFTEQFLQQNSQTVGTPLSTITKALSSITSNAPIAASTATLSYTITIPLLVTSIAVSNSFAGFLKWTIPGSQIGLQDIGVADLIAMIANRFGINISGNDIRAFADLLSTIGNAQVLNQYLGDLQNYDQLVSNLLSSSAPDVASLARVLAGANNLSNELANALGSIDNLFSNIAQRVYAWIQQVIQQLYQIFNGMETWVTQNLSLIASAVNSFLNWLYQVLSSALSYVYNVLQGLSQAHDSINTMQSSQNGISTMSSSVSTQSANAWSSLSDRLTQVDARMQQQFSQLCTKYEPVKDYVKTITKWGGLALSYGLGPFTGGASVTTGTGLVTAFLLGEDGLNLGCQIADDGISDVVQRISFADGASTFIGDILLPDGGFDSSIGTIIDFLGTAIPIAQQLQNGFSGSSYDLSGVSSLVSSYNSQYNQAYSAYHQSNPDYVAALGAIASLSSFPSIDAVSSVLQSISGCSSVMAKFQSYTQEGMVAPDLQPQVQKCQNDGQNAILAILSGQYSALLGVGDLPGLANQLGPELDARHQQFLAAKTSIAQLSAAISSIEGCGFLWVQPDPNLVSQSHQSLQLAQSQFSSGAYSDALNTANPLVVNHLTSAGQACGEDSTRAKVEVAGVILAAIAVSGFAYFVKFRPRKKS